MDRLTSSPLPSAESVNRAIRFGRRHWPTLLSCAVLGLLATIIYAEMLPRRYTAETAIMVEPRQRKLLAAQEVVEAIRPSRDLILNEIEIIKSPAILSRAALAVVAQPPVQHASGSTLSPAISAAAGSAPTTPEQALALRTTYERILSSLDVEPKRNSYVIAIKYTATTPEQAQQVADAVTAAYMSYQDENRLEAIRRATHWLTERISPLQDNVRRTEQAIEQFKFDNNLVQTGGQTVDEQRLIRLNDQLVQARTRKLEAQSRYEQAQQLAGATTGSQMLARFAQVANSEGLVYIRSQLIEVSKREAELSSRFGPQHPSVVRVRAEGRDLQRSLRAELDRQLKRMEKDVELAADQERVISAAVDELSERLEAAKKASVRLREMERDGAANKVLLEVFLARAKETAEQEFLNWPEFRVIKNAELPLAPSGPSRGRIIPFGIALFIMAGLGLSYAREWMDRSVRTRRQIEELVGAGKVVTIPLVSWSDLHRAGTMDAPELYVARAMNSPVLEGVKALGLVLELMGRGKAHHVVLLASPTSAERNKRAMLAAGIGRLTASGGKRTLLLNCDLSPPSSTFFSSAAKQAGLCAAELLRGAAYLQRATVHEQELGIDVITVPAASELPMDLAGSGRLQELVAAAREGYDVVIVNAPPLLRGVEASLLLPTVDAVLLVAEWGRTTEEELKRSIDQLANRGIKPAAVALTGVALRQAVELYGEREGIIG